MFIYYSARQIRQRDYKGPDFFLVSPTDGQRLRQAWIVWEEDGQYPNLIVELLSPSTAAADLGSKKDLYKRKFKTPEYFCFDPDTNLLRGWHLGERGYVPLAPNPEGRLWSGELQAFLGPSEGVYQTMRATWLRFFTRDGLLVPTAEERAEAAGV